MIRATLMIWLSSPAGRPRGRPRLRFATNHGSYRDAGYAGSISINLFFDEGWKYIATVNFTTEDSETIYFFDLGLINLQNMIQGRLPYGD